MIGNYGCHYYLRYVNILSSCFLPTQYFFSFFVPDTSCGPSLALRWFLINRIPCSRANAALCCLLESLRVFLSHIVGLVLVVIVIAEREWIVIVLRIWRHAGQGLPFLILVGA